ncbi:MAG: 3-hydroxyacyl-CoA dehydrogenase family protein, partial [Gemmatimonadaceae bacterium]
LLEGFGGGFGPKLFGVRQTFFAALSSPPPPIDRLVAAGRYGRKARKGFYLYDESGKKGVVDPEVYAVAGATAERAEIPAAEIQQRCVFPMLNEAVRCLEDGIIRSERDGDVGAVFGIGFPPFRGGPFRYIDSMGAATLVSQLEDLNSRFPGRFEPAEQLLKRARR